MNKKTLLVLIWLATNLLCIKIVAAAGAFVSNVPGRAIIVTNRYDYTPQRDLDHETKNKAESNAQDLAQIKNNDEYLLESAKKITLEAAPVKSTFNVKVINQNSEKIEIESQEELTARSSQEKKSPLKADTTMTQVLERYNNTQQPKKYYSEIDYYNEVSL